MRDSEKHRTDCCSRHCRRRNRNAHECVRSEAVSGNRRQTDSSSTPSNASLLWRKSFRSFLPCRRSTYPAADAILSRHPVRVPVQCVAGGRNRQESVHRGVRHVASGRGCYNGPRCRAAGLRPRHDAARPGCGMGEGRGSARASGDGNDSARVPQGARACDAAARGALCDPDAAGVSRRNSAVGPRSGRTRQASSEPMNLPSCAGRDTRSWSSRARRTISKLRVRWIWKSRNG